MSADEIEKIVKLIASTNDDEVKRILRRLLATWVEREGQVPAPTPGFKPHVIPTIHTKPTCSKCGLVLDKVMSYSCPHMECPTGMGPTVC
jgi:hypothetical protein